MQLQRPCEARAFHHREELFEVDHAVAHRTPAGDPLAFRVFSPKEILEGEPTSVRQQQVRAMDPAAVTAFYSRVTDIVVCRDSVRVEALEQSVEVPHGCPYLAPA